MSGVDLNQGLPGRGYVLFVTCIAAFLTPFMGSSVNIALPHIGEHFSVNAVGLGWVMTGYMLAAAVLLLPFGRLADMTGRRRIFLIGVTLDTAFSLLCSIAPTHLVLVLSRVGQGIGGAMIFSTGTAMLTAAYPPDQRGRVLGINVAAVYTGLSLGPVVGGLLTQHFGWRSVFLINVPLAATALITTLARVKPEMRGPDKERFDFFGTFIYALGLVALMYGLLRLPRASGGVLVLAGAAVIVLFLLWERRQEFPVLNVMLLLGSRVFLFSNLAALINYSATSAVGFLLSFYLQQGRGLAPGLAGLVLVSQPVMQAVFSPLAGRLSDRVAPRVVASLGMSLTVVGLVLLALLRIGTPLVMLIIALLVLGISFAFFSSPNTNAVMGSVQRQYYGVASGTLATMRSIGQMLSIGIALLLFSVFAGNQAIRADNYPAFLNGTRVAFVVFAVLCLVGVFASLARGGREGAEGPRVQGVKG